jgi:membrane fusion protein (multidrug efflux system)
MSNTEDRAESSVGTNVLALKDAWTPPARRAVEAKAPADGDPGQSGRDASHLGSGSAATGHAKHRRLLMVASGAILSVLLLAAGYIYWDHASHFVSTDDAFVAARQFSVAPRVAGYVADVPVTDNQHVSAGDVIARIDDRDFRVALEQAEAQVANATATISNVDAQIAVQQAQVSASEAQVEQARAALTFAEQQAARYGDLAASLAGTVQMAQQTASQLHQTQAGLKNAQAALTVAQRQIQTLITQRCIAEANLAQASAQRDQARLNLSYTTITAAQSGRVVNLTVAVGQYAQPGISFSAFVPDQVWVTANYKETQLAHIRPGQPVAMRIDAYPERPVAGHVDSIQSGSGTAFSLLPAQNATGNYVKIVQRVPVKIVLDNPPSDVALGPGMSVVPTVRVDATPSLYERFLRLR